MRPRGILFALLAATTLLTSPGWSSDAFASRANQQDAQVGPQPVRVVDARVHVPTQSRSVTPESEWSFVAVR